MKSIREILSGRPPETILSSGSAFEAATRMRDAEVGALLVVDDKGAAVGVFTERDLMLRVVVPDLDVRSTIMESVMSRDLYTVSPELRINAVASEMQSRHIRHLPVLENGTVIGMLSLRDLLREHIEIKRSEVQDLTSYIQGSEGITAADQAPPSE